MPAQTQKSSLVAKLGDKMRKSHESHKNDETTFGGGGDLPAGIDNGIAQLVDCRFGVYKEGDNKGEYFYLAAGVCVEPKEVPTFEKRGDKVVPTGSVKTLGLRFQMTEPMCETPNAKGKKKTFDDHYAFVLNELRKLGADTKEVTADDLEAVAQVLKESQPYFRFRTWKGEATTEFPNPRTNVDWRGVCEYSPTDADGVEDSTASEPPSEGEEAEAGAPEETQTEAPSDNGYDISDLAAAGEAADGGDGQAQLALANRAKELDIDYDAAESWSAVAGEIGDKGGDEGATESAEEPEEWKPVKGSVYKYKPPKAKKAIEVEVTAVFEAKQTANLKSLDDGKTSYKAVAWKELVQE